MPSRTPPKTPDQRLRVFISSTLKELAAERVVAQRAIDQLGMFPIMFELGARPHPPRELYRSYLSQSHIFVGIYWESYGWVAPDEAISGLEDEYRLSGNLPKLIYVKDAAQRDPRLQELLAAIRADDDASYKGFQDTDDLEKLLADDLALLLTERFEQATDRDAGGKPGSRPASLPAPRTSFVGRTRELQEVEALLRDPGVRLLTLTGPGGIGKSRLAFEVATAMAPDLRDGLRFVLLSTTNDPTLVPAAIARSLDVGESGGRPVLANLKDHLRKREMLILLDNFEHLVAAGPVLSELLAACPEVKILVTSRAVLRLRDEREYPVPPLSTPEPGEEVLEADDVLRFEAVRMFVESASSANPSFSASGGDMAAIGEICARLDGLPLAIELAAARTLLFTPEAMLPRLESRLKLLTSGPRDLPARQQTLRATLDWDYEFLTPVEQVVFRRLAVFAGGFDLVSGADAVDLERTGEIDILEALDLLLGKSLLRRTEMPGGEQRFSMLKTLREYALEKLEDSGEAEAAKRAHAEGFLSLAERALEHIRGASSVEWLDVLEVEHDNMRTALRWAREQDGDLELALAGALGPFWQMRSYLSEGQRRLEGALSRSARGDLALRARCLDAVVTLSLSQGEIKRAAAYADEAMALRRESGDLDELAFAIKNRGNVAYERGDFAEALEMFRESLDLRKQTGDAQGIAEALNNLGVVAAAERRWEDAGGYYSEALGYFREVDDKIGISRALMNLGEVTRMLGDPMTAAQHLRESIKVCQEMGSRWDLCDQLEEMAHIRAAVGDERVAVVLYGAADALRDSLGAALPVAERSRLEEGMQRVCEAMGRSAFDEAMEEGRRLDADTATELALSPL